MNTVFSFVRLLTFHSFIFRAQSSNYPLVFNPYTLGLYFKEQPDSKNIPSFTYPVFTACPAEIDEEKLFNENQSKDHKALFLREFYDKDIKLDDMEECKSNFELAVAVHPTQFALVHIEFGYEIYFEESAIPENAGKIKPTSYDYLVPISGNLALKNEPTLAENETVSFLWLKRMEIQFDDIFWKTRSVTYSLYRSADKIDVKCNDNNLGGIFYEKRKLDLDSFYTTENKKNVLSEVKLPNTACRLTKEHCLEKFNLLMAHHFQSSPSSTVSCSNLSTIPIWYNVSRNLLNYTEKFLMAMSEITSEELTVTSGGYQILTIPYENEPTKFKKIYLGKVKIPAPRIIYKVVKYEFINPYNKAKTRFEMVIVIHNEPQVPKENLCTDMCTEWGWESIQYLSTTNRNITRKSKFIYCCKLSASVREKFNYEVGKTSNDLKLKFFPYAYNESIEVIEYRNMRGIFENKMKELFEPQVPEHQK